MNKIFPYNLEIELPSENEGLQTTLNSHFNSWEKINSAQISSPQTGYEYMILNIVFRTSIPCTKKLLRTKQFT